MPQYLRDALSSAEYEDGLAMGVSTIQWPCAWLWQSAPPPAASSAAFVPITYARTSLMMPGPAVGRTGGCGPRMSDI